MVTADPSYCSLVLINRGVSISESGKEATVEAKAYGPANTFSCVLDNEQEFNCEDIFTVEFYVI